MLSNPSITVITVSFNSEKTIGDTLRSFESQLYKNKEHLIIDGGSTDKTIESVKPFLSKNVKLISEPDQGIYDAMNKGINLASGDVIGFLNSDDIFSHNEVLTQIANAFELNAIEAVYANLVYVEKENLNKIIRYWKSSSFLKNTFSSGWSPAHPTFYVTKKVYEKYGVFDTSIPIGNDIELMMRFLEKWEIKSKHINEIWVKMRIGGVSNRNIKNIIYQNYVIYKMLKKYQVPHSITKFVLGKGVSRLKQLCQKEYL